MNWTAPLQTLHKRGTLLSIGIRHYGHDLIEFVRCVNCATEYPILTEYQYNASMLPIGAAKTGPKCNGYFITECPFCREDSEPWKNGRGI